jgi:hypothetical protein
MEGMSGKHPEVRSWGVTSNRLSLDDDLAIDLARFADSKPLPNSCASGCRRQFAIAA